MSLFIKWDHNSIFCKGFYENLRIRTVLTFLLLVFGWKDAVRKKSTRHHDRKSMMNLAKIKFINWEKIFLHVLIKYKAVRLVKFSKNSHNSP